MGNWLYRGRKRCLWAGFAHASDPPARANMLFVSSTCIPSWMSHCLTSHKHTYRCRNAEGEACSAHIKNSYWRCQQGAQRSWVKFRGNQKEKCGTLLCLQPQVGWGFICHPTKEGVHPRTHSPGKHCNTQMADARDRWWILQYFGMLAEFLVSWLDRTGVQDLPKCQWVIVSGCKQWHKVSRQEVSYGVLVSTIN